VVEHFIIFSSFEGHDSIISFVTSPSAQQAYNMASDAYRKRCNIRANIQVTTKILFRCEDEGIAREFYEKFLTEIAKFESSR
jgi:hypothetical protein